MKFFKNEQLHLYKDESQNFNTCFNYIIQMLKLYEIV